MWKGSWALHKKFEACALFLPFASYAKQIDEMMKKVLTLAVVLAATLALSSCGTTEKCPTYSHVELPTQHG
jgi:hypothetical protein